MATKELKHCEFIKIGANVVVLRRLLMSESGLYSDEFFLLCLIYQLSNELGRPVRKQEMIDRFNILSYKRDKMLLNLFNKGLINNDREAGAGPTAGFKLTVTPQGEQLLIKYNKVMQGLCEGEK